MRLRSVVLCALACLLLLAGCKNKETDSSTSIGVAERNASADSLHVNAQSLVDDTTIGSRVNIVPQGDLDGAQFSQNADHSLFSTNGRYLIWKKVHTDTLCVYDLRAAEMSGKMWMPRGRGPGEFKTLSGATITADDIVYFAEPNQAKLLRFDVVDGPLEDLTFRASGFRPERVDAWGTQLVVSSSFKSTALLGVIGPNRTFRAASGLDVEKEFGWTLSFQAPPLEATEERAFYLTRYRPWIYVYDLESNRFVNKVVYGEVEVDLPEPKKTEDDVRVYRPPRKVKFFALQVIGIPGHPNRVFVQAKGRADPHTFTSSALYEIDVPTGTIVAEHDLGLKIDKVAIADTSLYVYDDEKRRVFAYRLRSSKP